MKNKNTYIKRKNESTEFHIPQYFFSATFFKIITKIPTIMSSQISEADQELLLHKLDIFKIRGKDKQGHKILRIIGKFFPNN